MNKHCCYFILYFIFNKMITIKTSIDNLFYNENIITKENFIKWCNKDKEIFYKYVNNYSHKHYNKLKNPKSSINNYYHKKLIGYKNYDIKYNIINNKYDEYIIKLKKLLTWVIF